MNLKTKKEKKILAMCQCNQGMKYFWEPGTENLPYDSFHWKHMAFALMRYDDTNYCDDIRICDEHGNCYKLHEDILMIFFIPYCEGNASMSMNQSKSYKKSQNAKIMPLEKG